MTRPIFLLTDFGMADTYVGIVKAVILSIAPNVQLVDLTHEIPPQDVRAGAFALLTAEPYLPDDAVVLAVVDPGVGTSRRAIAVQAGGRTYVGPDNGLLSWAVGTEVQAVVLDEPTHWLPSISATFHARDIFAPVGARLALGAELADLGSPTDVIVRFLFPAPSVTRDPAGRVRTALGTVIHVDRYGNLITSLSPADLPANPRVTIGETTILGIAPNYQTAPHGQLTALIGGAGLLEIAESNGSAATHLGVGLGASVTVTSELPHAAAEAVTPSAS